MKNVMISDTNTPILTVPTGQIYSTVSLIFCNLDETTDIDVDLFLVPQGKETTNQETQIVKQFTIPKTDTMLWSTERFIIESNQRLIQKQTVSGKIACSISYLEL